MPNSEIAPPAAHVTLIDSKRRLQAVARLASIHGHRQAGSVVRELAKSVGVECRGGRIYVPGRNVDQARGWERFIHRIQYGDSELAGLMNDMVLSAVRTGASVTISAELADQIRSVTRPYEPCPKDDGTGKCRHTAGRRPCPVDDGEDQDWKEPRPVGHVCSSACTHTRPYYGDTDNAPSLSKEADRD